MDIMHIEEIHPAIRAPDKSIIGEELLVIKNAMAIPGRAECEIASPNRLCFLKSANDPKMPEVIPNIPEPSKTVLNVWS
jgi:hypothetical protein